MSLIEQGISKGLIKFDEDKTQITYVRQNKKRNYNNPEEKVQAETFLKLALIYNYPVGRIKQFVSVQMGSETKEADIIVYADDECEETYILVECKKEDITDLQFNVAVDQAYSYAVAEGAKYVWTTSHIKDQYFEVPDKKPKSRIEIPDIPQFGISKLAPYKFVKGGISQENTDSSTVAEAGVEYGEAKQKFFELQVVTESELTKIFIQSHQALWGGGQRNPSVAFDELDKLIFCKIWDEKHPRKKGEPYDFQIFNNETQDDLLKRIKALYEEGRKKDPEVFKDDISLSANEAQTIVKYLQRINLNKTDLDSKGKAFETFMGSYFRGDFGQYFTPRPIVKFIVDSLPIKHDSRVLDTSCGSGGFLLYALDKVRTQASEFYDENTTDHYKYWHDFAEKNLFGIEINDQIARTAKMNMIIHDDGHTNVIASDGLVSDEEMQKKNKEFKYNSFDFIITNPPFGSAIKQTEKAYLHQYGLGQKEMDWLNAGASGKAVLRDSQSTEVLFIEQCHNFLVEQGYLAIVIPDGILTNSSLQYVRDNIEEMYRIVAVVSMPQTAFSATGAGVKSSVLFLRKHKEKSSEKITAQKVKLKEKLLSENKFYETIALWEKEKNEAIKKLEAAAKKANPTANKQAINKIIKIQKITVQTSFTDKVNLLKEALTEQYFLAKNRSLSEAGTIVPNDEMGVLTALSAQQAPASPPPPNHTHAHAPCSRSSEGSRNEREAETDDYPIFMAIAEDIGYDATGRRTGNNELIEIGNELSKFIAHINKTEK